MIRGAVAAAALFLSSCGAAPAAPEVRDTYWAEVRAEVARAADWSDLGCIEAENVVRARYGLPLLNGGAK